MNILIAKLKGRNQEFVKVMSTDTDVWELPNITNSKDYTPDYKLEDNEWYQLDNFIAQKFQNGIIERPFDSTQYNQIAKEKYSKLSYICSKQDNNFLFQRMTSSQFLSKKWFQISESPVLESEKPIIILNLNPDAYYDKDVDILYFRDISKIKPIFKGIEKLYREATNTEVEEFLNKDFISLDDNYSISSVGTMNRKRIALALKTYNDFSANEKRQIIDYTKEYCSDVTIENDTFKITSEEHLKLVCFGIEQRYYTTQIGHEKRLANSVLKIGQ